ncbi:MAG: hypothetical protein ABI615_08025 [Chthoniobacterales bacterium]
MSKTRKKSVKKTVKKAASSAKRSVAAKSRKPTTKRKASPKRKAAPKSVVKRIKAKIPKSPSSAVHQVAGSALKLVDQAASLLRLGIRNSASQTEKARLETKKRALSLVSKASEHLNKAVNTGTGGVRNIIGRL